MIPREEKLHILEVYIFSLVFVENLFVLFLFCPPALSLRAGISCAGTAVA